MIGLIKRLLALPHRTFRITVGTLSGVAVDRRQIDFLPIAGLQTETQALILFSLRENATSSEVPDCSRVTRASAVRVLRIVSGSTWMPRPAALAVSPDPTGVALAGTGSGARRAVARSCAARPDHARQVRRSRIAIRHVACAQLQQTHERSQMHARPLSNPACQTLLEAQCSTALG